MKVNVGHLIWVCTQFAYSYQRNLICISHHLEQLAKIVTVGIILRVSNVAFTVSFYGVFLLHPRTNLQNLAYSRLFPASMPDEGVELFTESLTQQNKNIRLLNSV